MSRWSPGRPAVAPDSLVVSPASAFAVGGVALDGVAVGGLQESAGTPASSWPIIGASRSLSSRVSTVTALRAADTT